MELFKAIKTGKQETQDLNIVATREVPEPRDLSNLESEWRPYWEKFYQEQAEYLYGLLKKSLPGGTIDNLFAVMAADKASLFKVAL